MNDPQDPNAQQYTEPAPQSSGLHFLEGLANMALAGVHLLTGASDEEGEDETEQPKRRRPRTRLSAQVGRAGTGQCCRAKRPTR